MMTPERLTEIERLAQSPAAKELIAEIRRCWEIMAGVRDAVFSNSQRQQPQQPAGGHPDGAMIEEVLASLPEHHQAREFVESLKAGFTKYGKLTDKQRGALQKFQRKAR